MNDVPEEMCKEVVVAVRCCLEGMNIAINVIYAKNIHSEKIIHFRTLFCIQGMKLIFIL
jgi:hypothetical protein